jgi:outer membrane lipoprotein-sorting protein
MTLRRGSGAQQLSGVLVLQTPAAVRFEALSPFGQPFLLLTVADGTLTSYQVADNRALVGPVTAQSTARWLGVPLEADDLVALLIGRPIPPRDLTEATILPTDGAGPSVRLVGRRQTKRVWVNPEDGAVTRVEIEGGRTPLLIRYEGTLAGGVPEVIHAASGSELEATLRYRNPAVSAGVDPDRFTISVPEAATVQRFH